MFWAQDKFTLILLVFHFEFTNISLPIHKTYLETSC